MVGNNFISFCYLSFGPGIGIVFVVVSWVIGFAGGCFHVSRACRFSGSLSWSGVRCSCQRGLQIADPWGLSSFGRMDFSLA